MRKLVNILVVGLQTVQAAAQKIAFHRQKQIEQGVNGKEFARVELRELKPIAARLQIDDAHTQRHCHHHQRHNGIGLHDVAQHFVGVNQIIYGDEVVANAKLLPEKIFAHRHYKQQQHINAPREIERKAAPDIAQRPHSKTQTEAHKFPRQEDFGYLRRPTTVFIENRMETININQTAQQQHFDAPSHPAFVFQLVETGIDNQQGCTAQQPHTEVSGKAYAQQTQGFDKTKLRILRCSAHQNHAEQQAHEQIKL